METTGDDHKKGIKSASGRQILCFLFYVALRFHSDTRNHMCVCDMKVGGRGTDGKGIRWEGGMWGICQCKTHNFYNKAL